MSAQENIKTRRAATQTTLFLICFSFLAIIEKRSKRRLKIEIFILAKNIVLPKNWLVVNNF